MSESQSNTQGNTSPLPVEKLIENLVDVGATWAKYGLNVGKSALETSSKTLSSTAEVLGEIAKRFDHKAASQQ